MMHLIVALTAALSLLVSSTAAGPYADDLAKCLVKSTAPSDKNLLIRWMFAGFSLHPELKSLSSLTDADREELNKQIAKMVEKLLTESCKEQTKNAVTFEGFMSLQTSFGVLGQAATVGMFSDPTVSAFMGSFVTYFDKEKMMKLLGPPQ